MERNEDAEVKVAFLAGIGIQLADSRRSCVGDELDEEQIVFQR